MVKVIVDDGGHGGKDPGAVGNDLKEKEVVMIISKLFKEYLNEHYTGFKVISTRTTDKFLELIDRAKIANVANADVFISFHNNSAANKDADGYEDFIYTGASNASKNLQNAVHEKVLPVLKKYGIKNRGKKAANLSVLRNTDMAAILTETLFISNTEDAALLKSNNVLKEFAAAYAEGVATFLSLPKKTATKPTNSPTASKPANKMIRVIYGGKEGLAVRENPNFNEKPVGHVKKGDAFTVVAELDNFYKLKSGLYITKHSKYVQVI
jgi:N-acetylmuramoyl-L-alanine amidase